MEFRRASVDDYPAILRLQTANFVNNLAPEDRSGGFLSVQFTLSQIEEMARDVGIIVAEDRDVLVGFLGGSSREFVCESPVIAALNRQLGQVRYRGGLLGDQRLFLYGPVVIERTQRGRGILRGLYERLLQEVGGRFDVGVAFVAENNPHSLSAHVAGLGMTPVGRFEQDGNGYVILAFTVPTG